MFRDWTEFLKVEDTEEFNDDDDDDECKLIPNMLFALFKLETSSSLHLCETCGARFHQENRWFRAERMN